MVSRDDGPRDVYHGFYDAAARVLAAEMVEEAERRADWAWEAARHEEAREFEPEALGLLAAVARRKASRAARAGKDGEAGEARASELRWLREAVARGEEWLGIGESADTLTDLDFSSARPYLAARFSLAAVLWEREEEAEAVWHLTELLRLQPSDRNGARYLLSGILAAGNSDQALRQLMARYSDDGRGEWAFLRALLAFRQEGDTPRSRRTLREAVEVSPESARLLRAGAPFDRDSLPRTAESPWNVSWILWVNTPAWRSTPGAIDWLRKVRPSQGRRRSAR